VKGPIAARALAFPNQIKAPSQSPCPDRAQHTKYDRQRPADRAHKRQQADDWEDAQQYRTSKSATGENLPHAAPQAVDVSLGTERPTACWTTIGRNDARKVGVAEIARMVRHVGMIGACGLDVRLWFAYEHHENVPTGAACSCILHEGPSMAAFLPAVRQHRLSESYKIAPVVNRLDKTEP
jgi:hypothetical protein